MALVARKLERLYGVPYRARKTAIEPRTSVSREAFFREKYTRTRKMKIEEELKSANLPKKTIHYDHVAMALVVDQIQCKNVIEC